MIDRRAFIATGTLALTGVLAGCGSSKPDKKSAIPADNEINIAMTTNDLLPNVDSRLAFVSRLGLTAFVPTAMEVSIADANNKLLSQVDSTVYDDSAGGPAYTVATFRFPKPGTYFVTAKTNKGTTSGTINVVDPTKSENVLLKVPKPGEKMIPFDSATATNTQGVSPFCTRTPQCSLHDQTISQALKESKPLLITFATPALCQTQTCGPIVDVVLAVKDSFTGTAFLHQEVYTDLTGGKTTPVVSAYQLQSEPVTFISNADGTIVHRIDGLIGQSELTKLLKDAN